MKESIKKQIRERIDFLVKERLLGAITVSDIDQWIGNFEQGSDLPYLLLNALIVVNNDQMQACVVDLSNKIKARFYLNNILLTDAELKEKYSEYLEETAFVCATRSGDAASSASWMGHQFRRLLGRGYNEYDLNGLCRKINDKKIKRVYIVDDFVGTGKQMMGFISDEKRRDVCISNGTDCECSVECVIRMYPDISFTIASIILCDEGHIRLREKYPNVEFLCCYKVGAEYDLLSKKCQLYKDMKLGEDEIDLAISEMGNICKEKKMACDYSLHLSCGFEDSFPNNALELFWWNESAEWTPLRARPQDRSPII